MGRSAEAARLKAGQTEAAEFPGSRKTAQADYSFAIESDDGGDQLGEEYSFNLDDPEVNFISQKLRVKFLLMESSEL